MSADFHQRVRALFDGALERPEPERLKFVQSECAGDAALFQAVERLLSVRGASESFMNTAVQPTRQMGRYHIRGELGRGGMGIVYDAVDPVIGRSVALKVINLKAVTEPGEAELMRERLFREARSCGQLIHAGIVIVFDVGQEDESAFIAMERVDGPSLLQTIASGQRLQTNEAMRILRETASALDYAHRQGVVHRDIKPANIMLRRDGTVKVADFGIAKVISKSHTTVTGVVIGTPSYMSPEQIEARPVTGQSDQFALAVLAYELLTGERPFRGESIVTVAHHIVYGLRPSARLSNPSLSASVDIVFQRGLARLPEERFRTCQEFVAALQMAVESEPRAAVAQIRVEETEPDRRRGTKPARWLKLAVSMAALIIGAAALVFFQHNNPRQVSQPAVASQIENAAQPAPAPPDARTKVAVTAPPLVKEFRAEPGSVKTGTPVMLSWDVTGADSVTIDHGIGTVSAKGVSAVVPSISTRYSLLATDSAGTTRRTAAVEVQPDSVPAAVRARQLLKDGLAKSHEGHMEDAAAFFNQAAELGDTGAMVELGECYRSGEGLPQDEGKAMLWFRKAAEAGNSSGMVLLGVMNMLGVAGADPNYEEAVQWLQKATGRDNPEGIYDLGTMYEGGHGVTRNVEKAKELYTRAAGLGNSEAQARLAKLRERK